MLTKEEGRKNLSEVVERFKRWKIERDGLTNEDDIKDLIYELFERVLGWEKDDIYKERHPGPTSKRADFQFKINDFPMLLLEAKPLNKSWDKGAFRQAIGYGWSANKEYVVLTNFQSFILFNAKWKDENKKIFEIENIEECLISDQKFDFLWLLSKESFSSGKIDEFTESIGKKFKKAEISTIDKQLLNDLKKWREILTKDIKSLNKLSESEVDEVIQKIINRLIFIRVCEDRGLEPNFAELRSHLRIWSEKRAEPLLKHLLFVFHHYDNVYDGTIFQKDDLCERIEIHNNILEKIIEQLYVAEDVGVEYNFASIDADVLGSVYEEYLGYLLKGKKIAENHVHRRKQGIYYTPTYIVDYIVRNTLGEVLKHNKEIDKIKVLDPACGSGSFLIKTFDVISEFYKEKIGEEKFNLQVKNSILTNNLYGVDLDSKAVEIAQLNLFLKIGEKGELPKLRENIKNGNSLIDDKKFSDKYFKWEQEFEDIMKEGGFDIVIGNPPYIDYREIDGMDFIKENYYSAKVKDKFNILILFIEKGLKILKKGGLLGFIVSNQFLCSDFGLKIREYILKNTKIRQIIDVSMVKVFRDASTYPIIIILEKSRPDGNIVKTSKVKNENDIIFKNVKFDEISQDVYNNFDGKLFLLGLNKNSLSIINKMKENSTSLKGLCEEITWGTSATGYGKKKIEQKEYLSLPKPKQEKYLKIIQTADIQRYRIDWQKEFIPKEIYSENKLKLFEKEKIVIGRLNKFLKATLDTEKHVLGKATLIICKSSVQPKFLLGILNSKLIDYYFKLLFISTHMSQGYIRYDIPYLEKLPIKIPSETQQKPLIELVNKIMPLNQRLNEIGDKKTSEREKIEEEVKRMEKEIDELVYEIYGISEKEQKIVEDSF